MNLKPVDEIGIKARELVGRKVRSAFRRLIFLTCSPTSDPRELAEGATRLPPYNALITYFESSPGNYRGFCRVCGSPIHSKFDSNPEVFGLPLGALNEDPQIKPTLHIFVGNKAPWDEITDSLPQYEELPPRA